MSHRLGAVIRRFRQQVGLTQQQAADLAGMSVAVLRDLEQGRVSTPRPTTLRRVAEALQLSVGDTDELLRSGQLEQVPAADLWIQVLGPLAVQAGGASVEVGSARQRLLLALLGLSPNVPLSQTALIEILWADQPPVNPTELLRINLSRLRRRLPYPHALVSTQGGYQLAVSENQLDLLMFRRLVGQARRSRQDGDLDRACRLFASATELWRGYPVEDLRALRSHPVVVAVSTEWRRVVVEYAETATAMGHQDEVLPLLRRVVEADPLHETAHAQLMLAQAASGQPATALATFDTLRDRLAEELGTDPGPELVEAHEAVQRLAADGDTPQPSAAPVSVYRQLPPDLTEFTGRREELRVLHERLPVAAEGRTAVVISSVVGMGGVGKTRLAVHLAHQLLAAGRYADLQLYVDLRGYAEAPPADPAAVLTSFLLLLGIPGNQIPEDLAGRAALYRDRLAGRSALVLLDNAASEWQVQSLLPASPASLVLITSRRPLALDGAQLLPLDVPPPAEAWELLATLAGQERVAEDPDAAKRVVELCGRLPLAVSLAARRLRARPSSRLAEFADRLAEAGDRLSELAAGSRQLHAVFELSYGALADDARRMFRLLGLHPGEDFTADSAAALAGLSPVAARRLLDRLVDEHLATMVTAERYRLHDLLRDYAVEMAAIGEPEPERKAALTRVLDYYLHTTARAADVLLAQRATVSLIGTAPAHGPALPNESAAVRWLDTERASLLAVVRFAAAHDWPSHAWQLAYELRLYQGRYGHIREWLEAHEIALAVVLAAGDEAGEAAVRVSLATAQMNLGRNREARTHLLRARELQDRVGGDPALGTNVLTLLGLVCKELGQFSEALSYQQQAAELCAGRDPYREAAMYSSVADVLVVLGRLAEARDTNLRSLTLIRQIQEPDNESLVLSNLGDVYRRLGQFDDALTYGEQAVAVTTDHGFRPRRAHALRRLGNTYQDLGRLDDARQVLHEAWQIVQTEDGDAQDESDVLIELGAVYCETGDFDRAGELVRQGLALAVETGARYQEACAHSGLAQLHRRAGDLERAEEHRERAEALFAELGVPVPGQRVIPPGEGERAGQAAAPTRE